MKRQLTEEMEADFFYVHDSIIYGALKKCGITWNHASYDDYKQIGLLKLVEAYEEFPESLFEEEQFYQFTGYAYRKVRWAIIDEIRKEQKQAERFHSLPDQYEEWSSLTVGDGMDEWTVWELFHSMLWCLSKKEQAYLKDSVLEQLTITEIAAKYGVSRKTVYIWKKSVGKKLSHFRQVLEK